MQLLTHQASSSRAYTPLADQPQQLNGEFASHIVKENGTIVYSRQHSNVSSSSSATSRSGSDAALQRRDTAMNGKIDVEEEDVGMYRKATLKGKEKAWDPEMGDGPPGGTYPPINETDEEERRVKENLARFAARDMARRRAARLSRQAIPPAQASSSSVNARPFSWVSDSRRNSLMGLMGAVVGNKNPEPHDQLPIASPKRSTSYPNPYEHTPGTLKPDTSPPQGTSPKSPPKFISPPQSPSDGQGFSYGYAGPSWRGGAAVQVDERDRGGNEKWWHALCGWGPDLDGGHEAEDQDDQAGRTNPFE